VRTWDCDFDDEYRVAVPPDANADERWALEKWGMHLQPGAYRRGGEVFYEAPRPIRILVPMSWKDLAPFNLSERNPRLFLEFAKMEPSESAVVALANQYGLLLGGGPETPGNWFSMFSSMCRAMEMLMQAKSSGNYSKVVRLTRRLLPQSLDPRTVGLPTSMLLDEAGNNGLRIAVRPQNLAGAVWAQFMLAAEGTGNFQTCDVCQTWIAIQADGSRSDRIYCSDACRMRAYRSRKGGG
jgi:hypothetical protein